MKESHRRLIKIALVGVFAAIAYVLSLFPKFNIFPIAPWMDVDLSDAPALILSVCAGPLYGFAVTVIKSLLHLTASTTAVVGLIANIICGGSFALAAGALASALRKKIGFTASSAASIAVAMLPQVVISVAANYFILLPMYGIDVAEHFGSAWYMVVIVASHNLIKNAIAGAAAFMVCAGINKSGVLKKYGFLH